MSSSAEPAGAAPLAGECAPRFRRLREAFEQSFRDDAEAGAAVAVWQHGEPVVDLWGGFADAARARPWQADTLVQVASTTKGVTALCANRLAEEGRLDLDAPVARYWPEFAQAGKQAVPVHWLLSHRAGLPALREPLPREALYDWDRATAALAAEEPWWEPGSRHGYHAMTFGWLVGEVLRRADGRSVGRYFREELALPLGLDFHIGLRPEEEARCAEVIPAAEGAPRHPVYQAARQRGSLVALAFGNPRHGRQEFNTPEWRRAELPAANGHGTARALARLYGALARGGAEDGQRLLGRDALARATRERAFGPDAVLPGLTTRFGLGFMLGHPRLPLGPGPNAFGHPGMGGSLAFADPDRELGFAYVMNRVQSGMGGDARGFRLAAALYRALDD
jgi:CubicO group peptidase (beta-lactamase class C family)